MKSTDILHHFSPSLKKYIKDTTVYSWWLQFDERMYKERNNFLGGSAVSNKPIRSRLGWFYGIWHGSEARESIPVFPKCLSRNAAPPFRFCSLHSLAWDAKGTRQVLPSLPWINIYRLISPACLSIMRSFPFAFGDDVTNRVRLQEIFRSLRNNLIAPSISTNLIYSISISFKGKINCHRLPS